MRINTPLRRIGVALLVNTAGGVIPALFAFVYRSPSSLHLWEFFRASIIYSYCIGTLCFAAMYVMNARLGRLRQPYPWVASFSILLAMALVGSLAANLVFLASGWSSPAFFWVNFRDGVRIAVAITILLGGVVTLVEFLAHRLRTARMELQARQLEEERARQREVQARLSSLESRIHPHFLFNTLNSISALIREDPARAERTVERLAALLRYSLDTSARPVVPLRQELRVVEDYLQIERMRFGERLRYTLNIPSGLEEFELPPLTLQTVVENSIKHVVSPSRSGGEIRVSARVDSGCLFLDVSDDGPGFDASALRAGHGLENLRDRLAALFDGAGGLEFTRRDGRMLVSIAVPQKKVLV
ncbi:MAG TPA: sensor histidine kinase [Bryobacteraceae bacterium]|nr:sensor histidine kinase [Bryobacteraceae bacterium]